MAEVPWLGLLLAFISAIVTNAAYSLEHDAAASLPPLSPRRPLTSATVLLRDRRWVLAFITESAGWLIYVAALRLAPLALVQALSETEVEYARGQPGRARQLSRRRAGHSRLKPPRRDTKPVIQAPGTCRLHRLS